MKLLKKWGNYSLRFKRTSTLYGERFTVENLGIEMWTHKMDTWKITEFERLFMNANDFITNPSSWKTLNYWTFFLGKEFRMYVNYILVFHKNLSTLLSQHKMGQYLSEIVFSDVSFPPYTPDLDDLDNYEFPSHSDIEFFLSKLHSTYPFTANTELPLHLLWNIFLSYIYTLFFYELFVTKNKTTFKYSLHYFLIKNSKYIQRTSSRKNMFFYIKLNANNILFSIKSLFTINTSFNIKNIKTLYIGSKLTNFLKNKIFFVKNFLHKKNYNLNERFLVKPILIGNNSKFNYISSLFRKQKVFTKSKYARSRQYCKNIVLFGLLLNIVLMFGLNASYYTILINTGFFIYPLYIFFTFYSIFITIKYRLYKFF